MPVPAKSLGLRTDKFRPSLNGAVHAASPVAPAAGWKAGWKAARLSRPSPRSCEQEEHGDSAQVAEGGDETRDREHDACGEDDVPPAAPGASQPDYEARPENNGEHHDVCSLRLRTTRSVPILRVWAAPSPRCCSFMVRGVARGSSTGGPTTSHRFAWGGRSAGRSRCRERVDGRLRAAGRRSCRDASSAGRFVRLEHGRTRRVAVGRRSFSTERDPDRGQPAGRGAGVRSGVEPQPGIFDPEAVYGGPFTLGSAIVNGFAFAGGQFDQDIRKIQIRPHEVPVREMARLARAVSLTPKGHRRRVRSGRSRGGRRTSSRAKT